LLKARSTQLRLASKVVRQAAALEVRQAVLVAVPREVSNPSFLSELFMILTMDIEFAHGKVDPHEAGKKGGSS
jgi:hypothetical protein